MRSTHGNIARLRFALVPVVGSGRCYHNSRKSLGATTAHGGQKACGGGPQATGSLSQCITVKDSQAMSQGHSYLESIL